MPIDRDRSTGTSAGLGGAARSSWIDIPPHGGGPGSFVLVDEPRECYPGEIR
jgi:hypothetical protein